MVEDLLEENDRLSGFFRIHLGGKTGGTTCCDGAVAAGTWRRGRGWGGIVIVEPLGSGGMGVVYRARDEKLERVVAIKMLPPGVLTGEEARRHFRREARALAKLNHPQIAAVYDVSEQDGADFIVMEMVAGRVAGGEAAGGRAAGEGGDDDCAAGGGGAGGGA